MFQDRLAALEGAEACVATSTGMAAIDHLVFGLLKSGDHLVAARGVFGTVVPLFDQIRAEARHRDHVGGSDRPRRLGKAVRPNTQLLFVETPSNPACEVADIAALAAIAKKAGACSRWTTRCARPRCSADRARRATW
jgi:O-succinylhomoserine sulfhydrylase